MIRVNKPAQAPKKITNDGVEETEKLKADYDAGITNFNFNRKIYGYHTVKNKLIKSQHGKCCFCESRITHISYGDVEHYRPKGGYQQDVDDPISKPGYYWLAYEWDNLFLACPLCNQKFKKNYFPLRDPAARAKNHHEDISAEEPLFINPAIEDPEEFIGFRAEMAYPKNDVDKANATIERIGLNRPELVEVRLERYELVSSLYDIYCHCLDDDQQRKQEVYDLIERYKANEKQFAAMVRATFFFRSIGG